MSVLNSGSANVSAFLAREATGALTPIVGSVFRAGSALMRGLVVAWGVGYMTRNSEDEG